MPTIEERAQALADSLATTVTTIAYGDSFEMDQDRASAMILAFAQSVRAEALREAARHLERRGWYMPPDDIRDLIDATPSAPPADVTRALARLRETGWMVGIHNDYRLDGRLHTFWLMTNETGRFIKGEGRTDQEAIAALERAALSIAERE